MPRDSRGITELNIELTHTFTGSPAKKNKASRNKNSKISAGMLKVHCFCQSGDNLPEQNEELPKLLENKGKDNLLSTTFADGKAGRTLDPTDKKCTREATVTLYSVCVRNLPRIHKYYQNSPSVTLCCGRWHMSTEIQANMALDEDVVWRDLSPGETEIELDVEGSLPSFNQWNFTDNISNDLSVVVYSGGIVFGVSNYLMCCLLYHVLIVYICCVIPV